MKLHIKPLLIAFSGALFLIACSEQTIPQEGEQYAQLAEQLNDKSLAPVSEVFSLTCGHCRNMEHFLEQIGDQAGSAIGKMHITFNSSAHDAAMLYYAAEMQLGEMPNSAFMDQLFAAVQMGKDKSEAERQQAIERAFSAHNLLSPAHLSEQQTADLVNKVANIERLSTQSGINAVPTFIVNGRYQIMVSGHKDPKQIGNTIRYLLSK
jgi:predicted DsbA family dithiol-disulfide isomerase